MTGLVAAELLKIRSTRTIVLTTLAGLALAAFLGFANASIAGDPGAAVPGSAAFVEDVLGVSAIPAVVALLVGVLAAAGEYQHGAVTSLFLAAPRRAGVCAASAIGSAVAGVVVAVAMVIAASTVAFAITIADGHSLEVDATGATSTVVSLLVAAGLLAASGSFLGSVLRSQVAALVVVVAWALVLETIVDTLVGGGVREWLPGGLAADLVAGRRAGVAAGVLGAWTSALGASAAVAVRRDVA